MAPCWGSVKMRRSMRTTLTQVDPAQRAVRRWGRERWIPVIVPGRHPADEPFAVADWRRRVAEIYADVRRIAADDPAAAHATWVQRRDELLAEHPASPLDAVAKASFEGLDIPHYDAAYRFECELRPAPQQRLDVSTGTDGVVPFERIGDVEVGDLGTLAVWRLRGYGGGLFVPVKDALAGTRRHVRRRAVPAGHHQGGGSRHGTATGSSST